MLPALQALIDWLIEQKQDKMTQENINFSTGRQYSNTAKGERYDFWKVLSAIRGQRDAGIWWEVEIGKTVETYQRRHSHKDNSFCFQQQRQGDWPRPCECLCGKRSFQIWYSQYWQKFHFVVQNIWHWVHIVNNFMIYRTHRVFPLYIPIVPLPSFLKDFQMNWGDQYESGEILPIKKPTSPFVYLRFCIFVYL